MPARKARSAGRAGRASIAAEIDCRASGVGGLGAGSGTTHCIACPPPVFEPVPVHLTPDMFRGHSARATDASLAETGRLNKSGMTKTGLSRRTGGLTLAALRTRRQILAGIAIGRRGAGLRAIGQIDLGLVFRLLDARGGDDMLVIGDIEQLHPG